MGKIPSYPALTTPNDADLLIIEDSVTSSTKKITRANFLTGTALPNSTVTTASVATGAITTPKLSTELQKGWEDSYGATTFPAPNTVTYNGNRSYDLVFNSVNLTTAVSNGQRLRTTRTVTAPTQCTSLNGTTQYYNKSSPAGTTFTDDFVVSAWVKLSSYPTGAQMGIASRYNGTSGWSLQVQQSGQVLLAGYNAGAANTSYVISYQSLPLNKWVHVTAQLDMSAFTATTTTSYVMIDGVDVPASVARGGTNPTVLVQPAADLTIGSINGAASFFQGKIAQVAIYSAKVTQANIRATISQGLSGSETSLISAYSFNNSINDLNANANNLTANGSAVATNADSPFSLQADGTTAGTTDYAIITKTAFSTNTTLTVQVPEGNTIPTTGGVSAVAYSSQKAPYGFPGQRGKWTISHIQKAQSIQASAVSGTWYNVGNQQLNVPVGEWSLGYQTSPIISGSTALVESQTLSTGATTESDTEFTTQWYLNGATTSGAPRRAARYISISAATPYYLNLKQVGGSSVTLYNLDAPPSIVEAELATL